jgi:hypothetical protein
MTYDEFLSGIAKRAEEHQQRAVSAAQDLTSEQFNAPAGREWSVARVFKHLCLANEPYIKALEEVVAKVGAGHGETKHSFFGKILMKASGPGGNAPAPAFLIPPDLALSKEVIEEWRGYQQRLIAATSACSGKNLSMGVRNPFFRIIPMKLADLFAILDVHNERHVQQIEERSRLATKVDG